MSDILGAIEKEREYLSYRMKNEEPFHLVDAVKEFGFESLKEYFDAKRDYLFSQLRFEVVEATAPEAIGVIQSTLTQGKTALLFAKTDFTLVWNGNGGSVNEEYCTECGIPIYPYYTGGGTIVSTAGDLNIGICYSQNDLLDSRYILKKFADLFRKYTNKAVLISGNDPLVGGIKMLGSATYLKNGMFMFVTSVSLSEKEELISAICEKHSTKQPGHIDFIDADTLRQEVEQWQGQ